MFSFQEKGLTYISPYNDFDVVAGQGTIGLVNDCNIRGGSSISGKGVHTYKGVGVRFPDFISSALNIP